MKSWVYKSDYLRVSACLYKSYAEFSMETLSGGPITGIWNMKHWTSTGMAFKKLNMIREWELTDGEDRTLEVATFISNL